MPKNRRASQLNHSMPFLPVMPLVAILVGTSIFGCAVQSPATTERPSVGSREDIFVLRSIREERTAESEWCTPARTAFEPLDPAGGGFVVEDRFSMWAVATQASDGRVTDAKANRVGELRACFRSTADPKVVGFFADARLQSVSFIGSGNCVAVRPDFPEKGITPFRCFLELRDLPAPYASGWLTTNTIGSRAVLGDATDPSGYVQPSIATIRLWRAQ